MAQSIRFTVLRVASEQRGAGSGGGVGDDEARELVAVHGKAVRLGALLVLADRLDHPPESRIREPVQAVKAGRQRCECGVIERSEEHTSELQSPDHLVCRLLLEKKKKTETNACTHAAARTATPSA